MVETPPSRLFILEFSVDMVVRACLIVRENGEDEYKIVINDDVADLLSDKLTCRVVAEYLGAGIFSIAFLHSDASASA